MTEPPAVVTAKGGSAARTGRGWKGYSEYEPATSVMQDYRNRDAAHCPDDVKDVNPA